jgi:hypothetical protein
MSIWEFLSGPPPSNDEQHRAAERDYWRRQLSISKGLNWITLCAAAAAVVGLIFVSINIRHADQGTIDANRAWIAPYTVQPIGKTALGGIMFEVTFLNTGKTPALGLNWKTDSGTKETPANLNWSLITFDRNATCDGLLPIPQGPVSYAHAPGEILYTRRADTDGKVLFDSISDGKSILYLRGCVAYMTMGVIGRSAFCWMLDPMVPDAKGGISGHSNLCESGSFAE